MNLMHLIHNRMGAFSFIYVKEEALLQMAYLEFIANAESIL